MTANRRTFEVVKASGRTEPYDREKIAASLRRSGTDPQLIERVLDIAERSFHPGVSTRTIFRVVLDILDREESRAATLYDLKGGIRRLGPAGYSFETYVAEILREFGHRVSVRQTIQGRCATHEIDVVTEALDDGRLLRLVECKYHQTAGTLVDLKELMYTWARLLDINERPGIERPFDRVMMVSNTRVSNEALRFATCREVEVLSWKYPAGKGLEEMIKSRRLYPVTILKASSPLTADLFSRAGLMLVKDFAGKDPGELAVRLHLPMPRTLALVREAEAVMGNHGNPAGAG